MRNFLRVIGGSTLILGAFCVPFLFGVRECNKSTNNRVVSTPTYTMHSYATGVGGHAEYIRYADGSQEAAICPSMKFYGREYIQDSDGDCHADKIRLERFQVLLNDWGLDTILIRGHDYQGNKEKFDDADRKLQELAQKYPTK